MHIGSTVCCDGIVEVSSISIFANSVFCGYINVVNQFAKKVVNLMCQSIVGTTQTDCVLIPFRFSLWLWRLGHAQIFQKETGTQGHH